MFFIALMSLSTIGVASIAEFFSVWGLAHTFAGAFWSVVAMGAALGAGKLMLASFVYRYKSSIGWRIKLPAYAFITALMIVTSTGIYGYLSAGYQTDTVGAKEVAGNLDLKKQEQVQLQTRKTQIDQQISQLPTNDVRGRQKLMKQFDPEVKDVNTRLTAVTKEIQDLSQQQITTEAHIGPIVYIAKMIGTDADKAISILMLLIIFAFDPLAMLLTIATNIAIDRYREKKEVKRIAASVKEPVNIVDTEPVDKKEYLEKIVAEIKEQQRTRVVNEEDAKNPLAMKEDYFFGYPASAIPPEHLYNTDREYPPCDPSSMVENFYFPNYTKHSTVEPEVVEPPYDPFVTTEHHHYSIPSVEEVEPELPAEWFYTGNTLHDLPAVVEAPNSDIEQPVEETKQDVPSIEPQQTVENSNNIKQVEAQEVPEQDQDLRDRLQKFEARQDLIRSTRRD